MIALIFGSFLLAPAALAQRVCGQHGSVSDNLRKSYSEAPVSMGLMPDGGVIEVFASKEGAWTMMVTQPTGISCLIAVGQSWENLPKPEMISGAKT
ncbi:MAG: hypothetical protein V3R37_04760 [Rhodospirillales bacterium]